MRRFLPVLGLSLTLAGVIASPVAAMQQIDPAFSDTILSELGYPSIEIEVGPGGIDAPESIEAGFYHVTLNAELDEHVAYLNFVGMMDQLSGRTQVVVTFALCGFANLSSIAMLLGGLGTLAPDRPRSAEPIAGHPRRTGPVPGDGSHTGRAQPGPDAARTGARVSAGADAGLPAGRHLPGRFLTR